MDQIINQPQQPINQTPNTGATPTQGTTPPPPQTPPSPAQPSNFTIEPQNPPKSNKGPLLLIITFILILIMAVITFFVIPKNEKPAQDAIQTDPNMQSVIEPTTIPTPTSTIEEDINTLDSDMDIEKDFEGIDQDLQQL